MNYCLNQLICCCCWDQHLTFILTARKKSFTVQKSICTDLRILCFLHFNEQDKQLEKNRRISTQGEKFVFFYITGDLCNLNVRLCMRGTYWGKGHLSFSIQAKVTFHKQPKIFICLSLWSNKALDDMAFQVQLMTDRSLFQHQHKHSLQQKQHIEHVYLFVFDSCV